MAKKGPGISELVYQIVREAPEPLAIEEIAERLAKIAPTASHNPKNSVKNTLSNNRDSGLMRLPSGKIGWKPRLINGATLRHIFYEEDLVERELLIGADLRDLFEPLRSAPQAAGALRLELEGGRSIIGKVTSSLSECRLDAGPALWDWLERCGAAPGDSLIITALDGEERHYALRHEPAAARDEAAIAERNQVVLESALAFLRRFRGRAALWEIVSYLNATGPNHHPLPADPFEDFWLEQVYQPVQAEYGVDFPLTGGFEPLMTDLDLPALTQVAPPQPPVRMPVEVEIHPGDLPPGVSLEQVKRKLKAIYGQDGLQPISRNDPLLAVLKPITARNGLPSPTGKPYLASELEALFGSDAATIEWIERGALFGMVEIDDAFDSLAIGGKSPSALTAVKAANGKPRKASPQGSKGTVTIYRLRLTYRDYRGFSRELELAEDQSLEDLHLAIQQALGWENDHLYSFFMGPRPYDQSTEIGSPWSEAAYHANQVTLGSLGLKPKQQFLYLFDYGDNHLFDLMVLKITPQAPRGNYPKIVARQGRAPTQYGEE